MSPVPMWLVEVCARRKPQHVAGSRRTRLAGTTRRGFFFADLTAGVPTRHRARAAVPEHVMSTLDFSKLQGLVPAVVQDADTRDVLMVGFMNQEAWDRTRSTGFATFFSRSRNALWTKGETSGNRLQVVRALVDCDHDTVLLEARCLGDGVVCHTGERSCFFTELSDKG